MVPMTMRERLAALSLAAGRLLADDDVSMRWVGSALLSAAAGDPALDRRLKLRPRAGSHRTATAALRDARCASLLRQLLDETDGCVSRASRLLRGIDAPSARTIGLVDELVVCGCPRSQTGLMRLLRRVRME